VTSKTVASNTQLVNFNSEAFQTFDQSLSQTKVVIVISTLLAVTKKHLRAVFKNSSNC